MSRPDGRLALGRLGSLCEEVSNETVMTVKTRKDSNAAYTHVPLVPFSNYVFVFYTHHLHIPLLHHGIFIMPSVLQIEALVSEGREVILVTSGAVGIGRQKLRFQKLMRSSFHDLQRPQEELCGKPCAAVGQGGLMSIYETLFNQVRQKE